MRNITKKKLTRGIDEKFAEAFKQTKLFVLYKNHKDELFIGVRNNFWIYTSIVTVLQKLNINKIK